MHEKAKLAEARYFYSRMLSELDNTEHFRYDLSAFLSSARSVLQYAYEETKNEPEGKQWYDRHMVKSRILSFFRCKRDINIHTEPVKPAQDMTIAPNPARVLVSGLSPRVVITDADGNIIDESESPPETEKPEIDTADRPGTATTRYRFTDWPGNEVQTQL